MSSIDRSNHSLGFLPSNLLFYDRNRRAHVAVAWFKQGVRTLNIQTNETITKVKFDFPYVVFVQVTKPSGISGYTFFTKSKPNERTVLYHSELPNEYSNGSICLGDNSLLDPARHSPEAVVKAMYNTLFSAVYTADMKTYYAPFKRFIEKERKNAVMRRNPDTWRKVNVKNSRNSTLKSFVWNLLD